MVKVINWVGHCTLKNHNKVYVLSIHKTSDDKYHLIGKWGRFGREVPTTINKGDFYSFLGANIDFKQEIEKRKKRNYVDITSTEYGGLLSMDDEWLQGWLAPSFDIESTIEDSKKVRRNVDEIEVHPESDVVTFDSDGIEITQEQPSYVCINNAGMEDSLTVGNSYSASDSEDAGFYWVIDDNGEKREVFSDRFKE